MAKYFVGYLIQGEAAEWHNKVAKEVSDTFSTWKIYENVPPHITIYRPFDTDNIQPVLDLLETWSKSQNLNTSFTMSGFDRFGDRVIFANIETNPIVEKSVLELRQKLMAIPGMPPEDHPNWRPHATLADRINSDEFTQIWDYVSRLEKPKFNLPFDNITVLSVLGDRGWHVYKTFRTQ